MITLAEKTLDEFLSELRQLDVKLWAEGERLRYKAAKDALTPELLTELRNRKSEVLEFLQRASLATNLALTTISPISRDISLPLSFSQERLWFQHQLEPNSPINNMPAAYRLKGRLNMEIFHRIQNDIIERHEILRTTFPAVNRQPTVAIAPSITLPIPIQDLQSIPLDQREEEAQRLAIEESRRPFDLEHGPLLRLHLFRLSPEEHLLILTLHRIVSDGWSVDILFREILALYEAYALGKLSPLAKPSIQYVDYAYWQRQKLQGEFLETQLRYWKQQLGGKLPRLNLPTDRPRPPIQTFVGSRRRLMFSKTLNDALNALSQEEGATLFMTLLAAFKVLLYRYANQEDVMICFPHAGRQQVEVENLIGSFFNTLVLRTSLAGEPSFRALIQRVKDVALGAFAHQELPFDQLIANLNPGQGRGRSSLFQVMFALNPPWTAGNTLASVELPGLTIDSLFGYLYTGQTKFDLTLIMRETDEGLRVLFEYNTDLFDGETILRMMDHFRTLLESIVANPDEQISKLSLLRSEEKQQMLVAWDNAEWQCSSSSLHDHFGLPIDRNLPKAQIYILDREYQPVPICVLGELYVDETCLSKEALNSLEQSSENFIPHPLNGRDGVRLYNTGKLARHRPAGTIDLVSYPYQEVVEEMQLDQREAVSYVASRDKLEQQLIQIWEEVLNIQPIGIRDNFFDLGGHSLLAVRLFAQIEKDLNQSLPLSVLLQAPTIEQLGNVLRQGEDNVSWSPLVEIQAGDPGKPILFCIHGGGFNVLVYRDLALNLGPDQPVYGLQAQGLYGRGGIHGNRLEDIASDYINEIRSVQPKGPYYLSGLSSGGDIALEMAQQIQAQGEQVALLGMFDSYGPDGITFLPPFPRLLSSLNYALRYSLPRLKTRIVQKGLASFLHSLSRQTSLTKQVATSAASNTDHAAVPHRPRPRAIEDWMNTISQYILEHSPWSFLKPTNQLEDIDSSLSDTLKALEEKYSKIHEAYKPRPYSGKITLFLAEEGPPGYKRAPALGWNKIASEVEVYPIPGHHTSIMQSEILANYLNNCIKSTL
jgi:thioesterase domain-containing protein/acyl carrier protein